MPKIMITGINGFVGKHLAHELKKRDVLVVGIGREAVMHPTLQGVADEYFECDLTSKDAVAGLPLSDIDGVINLAGFANVGASFGQEELYMKVNVGVLSVISERILELGSKTRMLAVSTGAVYASDQLLPLREDSKLISTGSPYALSKIAMEHEAERLRTEGLNCVIARPFNHIGPGQEPGFLVADLYEKMLAAITGDEIVKVGDLSTRRDYTDVRDVVRAYADLILSENLDEQIYNICSGRSVPGSTIYDLLTDNIEGSDKIEAEVDQKFIRPGDPKDLYGDNSRLRTQANWQPLIPIEQTIKDFVAGKKTTS
jgi:GDP-4-dehydro-6-deoxy-D-mannose reductase